MSTKKEAGEFLRFLHKKWNYTRDLLSVREVEKVRALKDELQQAADGRLDVAAATRLFGQTPARLEKIWPGCTRPNPWAKRIETVFWSLVAVIVLKCYFVQSYKIPTDSMKPTLWGIYPEAVETPAPNISQRILDYAVSGKSYHTLTAREDGVLEGLQAGRTYIFWETSVYRLGGKEYLVWTDFASLKKMLANKVGQRYKRGDLIANFTVQEGDHIFVNKLAYHFRLPRQ